MKTLRSTPFSIAILAAVTLVSYLNKTELELINIAMLYMLPILFAALFLGTLKTAVISILSVTTFNILFIPPAFSLTVYDGRYVFSFAIMFFIGIIMSVLAQKAAKIKELELSEKLSKAIIGSLSHELRTPLAAIIGASSTLLSKELNLSNEQKKSLHENIFESSGRMQKLVETLLAEARFAGGVKPILKECDIIEMTEAVLSRYEREYKKIADFNAEANLPIVSIDAELLEQALCIVMDNAFKYGEHIKIDARRDASYVVIEICNDGNMPTKNEIGDIGKKSSRLSNSKEKEGSGLGLYLCLKIAEILNIRIGISVKDGLFCVNIKIPAIT